MKSAREVALLILYRVENDSAYPNILLKEMIDKDMSKQDRALVTNLVYGVINRQITLDYIISQKSKVKLKKLSKYILLILRMGIYQLLFMNKIPQSAAVNESVKLAKRYGHSASSGYVNGVLRNVAKNGFEYPKDKTQELSIKYSFPLWICKKWTDEFGFDFTSGLMKAFLEEPKLVLRPNILKTDIDSLSKMLCDNGIELTVHDNAIICSGLDVANDTLYQKGFYTVQDIAAMQTAKVLAPQKGDTVIDMCSAPGGKTTHIAEIMQNSGKIYAFDVYEHKIELVRSNAKRLGIDIIDASLCDATVYNEKFKELADKVLCDVPCSGTGIIRRKPDIKFNRKENDSFYEVQSAILNNGARYVKHGGVLVYSTCSIEREENEAITCEFLDNNKEFERLYEKTYYPNIDGTDGFYICKMKRN